MRFHPAHFVLLIITLMLLGSVPGFAQYQEERQEEEKAVKGFNKANLRYGGNLWFNFGRVTYVDVSPKVGYMINKRLTPGLGFIFQYYKEEFRYSASYSYQYQTTILGGSVFSSFTVIDNFEDLIGIEFGSLMIYSEYQIINIGVYSSTTAGTYYDDGRCWVNRFLIGGGISQRLGKRSSVSLMILWDIISDPHSPYQNPVFQVGLSL
ncbi:MAG: hypothetical protein KJ607_08190 [Bacteroidetes bacterium]|nr:hypothetical protein [Bacteroidota bacterium]